MKRIAIIFMLLLSTAAFGQNRSIKFQATSLTEAFKMAKELHKMIFVDCYTTWCIPCKQMEANVFTDNKVADFFNEHFINVKLDMEKGEGPAALKTYAVGAFPSYLLFDQDGKQLYKFVGGMTADEFMTKIKVGINPNNEIATREARYAAGDRDHALLRDLIKQKFRQKETAAGQKITDEYFALLSPIDKLKQENWFLFEEGFDAQFISDMGSPILSYLLAHYQDFEVAIGKEKVGSKIDISVKKFTERCLSGYYFKGHAFDKEEFERYKQEISSSKVPDKAQLQVFVDVAKAAGENDAKTAGKLLAENFAEFSQNQKDVVFEYFNFCASKDRTFPYINEINKKVAETSKNSFLVSFCADYVKRLNSSKSDANE